MNKLLLVAAAGLGIAALSSPASAADGTITFQGSVVGPTCTITGAKDFTVNLPTVSTSTLTTSGVVAGAKAFTIGLAGCAAGNVRAYFEPGATIDATTNNLKNSTGPTFATNVQVQLLNSDQTPINLTTSNVLPTAINAGSNTLTYYAQYFATGLATAGTVTTSVQYTLQYN